MKYSRLGRGTKSEQPVEIPGFWELERDAAGAVVLDEATGEPKLRLGPDGRPIPIVAMVRPLTGPEEAEANVLAREYAKRNGSPKPQRGDALFDLGWRVAVIATAYLDKDSPPSAREPFFDGGFEQILDPDPEKALESEVVAYLYERAEAWQSLTSPFTHQMAAADVMAAIEEEAASEDDRFFRRCSPGLQWSLWHTAASLVASSPEARSLLSSFIERVGAGIRPKPRSSPSSSSSDSMSSASTSSGSARSTASPGSTTDLPPQAKSPNKSPSE